MQEREEKRYRIMLSLFNDHIKKDSRLKNVLYLAHAICICNFDEKINADKLIDLTGMPEKTLKMHMHVLKEMNLLIKDGESNWYINMRYPKKFNIQDFLGEN